MDKLPIVATCLGRTSVSLQKTIEQKQGPHKEKIPQDFSSEKENLPSNLNGRKDTNHGNTPDSNHGAKKQTKKKLENNGNNTAKRSTDVSVSEEEIDWNFEDQDIKYMNEIEWMKILRNNDLENTSHAELDQSLRYGIPQDLRPQIWAFLAGIETLKNEYEPACFEKLSKMQSTYDSDIEKDVDRTFSDQFYFMIEKNQGQKALFKILRAYANFDREVGYTQGMNYIAGTLLVVLDPNNYKNSKLEYFKDYEERYVEDAFWIFVYIVYVKNYRGIYKREFPKLRGMVANLAERLEEKTPNVSQHIKEKELEPFLCFHKMFLSLFSFNTPIELSTRVIDLFLIEQEKVLFKLLIRAVIICQKEILEQKYPEDLSAYLDRKILQTCYNKYRNKLYVLFPSPESTD